MPDFQAQLVECRTCQLRFARLRLHTRLLGTLKHKIVEFLAGADPLERLAFTCRRWQTGMVPNGRVAAAAMKPHLLV